MMWKIWVLEFRGDRPLRSAHGRGGLALWDMDLSHLDLTMCSLIAYGGWDGAHSLQHEYPADKNRQ